jgi:RimJ/RimL family protein N-acetyltransferase
MYIDRYKACDTIFKGIPKLDLGGLHLRGFFPNSLEEESKFYLNISNDSDVKKFLPGAYCADLNEATQKINKLIDKFLLKISVPFVISARQNSTPIGYVICNSPLYNYKDSNEKIGDWTIDFWINKSYRGQKLLHPVIYKTIGYLQSKEVDRVYMYVDKINLVSIHIIEKCGLVKIGESGDGKLFKYGVILKPNCTLT